MGGGALGIRLDGGGRPEPDRSGAPQLELRPDAGFKTNQEPYLYYLNDYLTQNGYDTNRKQSVYAFTYMLHGLAHAYTERIESALCIGMGIGIVPMQLAREGVSVDVVEINPAVVARAALLRHSNRAAYACSSMTDGIS